MERLPYRTTRKSTRLKYYGDELVEVFTASRPIFNPDGEERDKDKDKDKGGYSVNADNIDELAVAAESEDTLPKGDIAHSKRRARKTVYDLAMCNNDLDTFVTFTISPRANIDRYDVKSCVRRLGQWLSNRVKRNGLKYVFVCELHKDGAAHFHGLLNSNAVKLVDSGHKDGHGRTIYNVADWKYGYTTAMTCYGYRADCVKYITKYISKAESKVCGRWYYSGGDLSRPRYEYLDKLDEIDPKMFAADNDGWGYYEKEIPEAGLKVMVACKQRPCGEFADNKGV